MSKERLEKIKKENSFYLGFKTNSHVTLTHTMPIDDINWLIQQAERVEDYKTAYEIADMLARSTIDKANELKQQNKRYREALEFYASKENYKPINGIFFPSYQNKVDEDGGKKARQALKGE